MRGLVSVVTVYLQRRQKLAHDLWQPPDAAVPTRHNNESVRAALTQRLVAFLCDRPGTWPPALKHWAMSLDDRQQSVRQLHPSTSPTLNVRRGLPQRRL